MKSMILRRRLCSAAGRLSISPHEAYRAAVSAGRLEEDPLQLSAIEQLERLHNDLLAWRPPPPPPPPPPPKESTWKGPQMDAYGEPIGGGTFYTGVKNEGDDGGLFSRLTGLFGGGANDLGEGAEPELSTGVAAPKGVYLYGGSGCGKSMMVDELLAPAIVAPPNAASTWVRRVHLSEFLLEVHQRAHRLRQETPSMGDPTPYLAYELICETQVLLLDEVAVTDVADALMIRKLFRRLFHSGMIIVCTSNRAPGELYLNGLQRASFLPFIADIEQRCHVHALGSSTDYRAIAYLSSGVAQLTSSGHGAYLQPLSSPTTHGMSAIWEEITKGAPAAPAQISLMGRSIDVPLACDATRTARFAFNDLCRQPLGPEDYLRLSRSYGAILVEGVPRLTLRDATELRRARPQGSNAQTGGRPSCSPLALCCLLTPSPRAPLRRTRLGRANHDGGRLLRRAGPARHERRRAR